MINYYPAMWMLKRNKTDRNKLKYIFTKVVKDNIRYLCPTNTLHTKSCPYRYVVHITWQALLMGMWLVSYDRHCIWACDCYHMAGTTYRYLVCITWQPLLIYHTIRIILSRLLKNNKVGTEINIWHLSNLKLF